MKKYILTIAFLSSFGSYAQQQNVNWYFGENTGLTFTPDPLNPTPITTALTSMEGCASYSNQSGTMIFYTNGIEAFNRSTNSLMPNGGDLRGHTSSTSNVIIIPKPLESSNIDPTAIVVTDPQSLYLVTIDGYSGAHRGLHYSEVNLLTNNTAEISLTDKNIVLEDHNGNNINDTYLGVGNMSEKITSAPHCNGIDYWLIAQIGDRINSYLVTRNGISIQPSFSSQALVNIQAVGSNAAGMGQIKISPNNKRLAVCYQYTQGQFYGTLALGDFDNLTGEVTFDGNLIFIDSPIPTDPEESRNNNDVYGTEFSLNSSFVYFGIRSHIYRANANGATSAEIQQISVNPVEYRMGLQRSYSGRIYVSSQDSNDVFSIGVINNPNDAVNFNFQENVFPNQNVRCTFPQWIHWQTGSCPNIYTLFSPETHTQQPFKYQAANSITTTTNYVMSSGKNIHMTAGNFILMRENTDIQTGSVLTAEIAKCGGCN